MAATAALIPAGRGATEAIKAVSEALTGDLVVIKGKIYREREIVTYGPDLTPKGRPRKHTAKVLEPVEIEAHINPVSLAVAGAAVGVGALGILAAGWVAGVGVTVDQVTRDRIDLVNLLIAAGEEDLRELAPDDPARANVKIEVDKLKAERRSLRFRLLRIEVRPRFQPFTGIF